MTRIVSIIIGVYLLTASGFAYSHSDGHDRKGKGLDRKAKRELVESGVTQYVGEFSPAVSEDIGQGWTKHTFDPGVDEGPICITGSPYSVFTKAQNPKKLLIMLQGGGACWQGFYNCNLFSEAQEPPPPPVGIWSESLDTGAEVIPNPIGDWSVVYMPYCDGSVFSGDNAVVDPAFQAFVESIFGLPPGAGPQIRFHRGLRNVTAGIDVARSMFRRARTIMVAGSSAGGVGASGFAPLLVRMAYGNNRNLLVFNDAGPIAINLLDVENIHARAADWRFGQFYPASCTDCDDVMGQGTAITGWRMDRDKTVRESFYSTDGDATNRFFLQVPTQELYRGLIVSEHGELNAAHPSRYKRFIRSGDDSHTALQTPLFYLGSADAVPLYQWVDDFIKSKNRRGRHGRGHGGDNRGWIDIVEDFVPLPVPAEE